jgi:hypothetical protein
MNTFLSLGLYSLCVVGREYAMVEGGGVELFKTRIASSSQEADTAKTTLLFVLSLPFYINVMYFNALLSQGKITK